MKATNKNIELTELKAKELSGVIGTSVLVETALLKTASSKCSAYEQNTKEILKLSIEQYGIVVPVIIDKDHNVLSGNRRVQIARELNIQKIAVIFIDENLNAHDKKNLEIELHLSARKISYLEGCLLIADYHADSDKKTAFKDHMAEILGVTRRTVESHIVNAKSFRMLPETLQEMVYMMMGKEELERTLFDSFTKIINNETLTALEDELKHHNLQEMDSKKLKSILSKFTEKNNEMTRNSKIDEQLVSIEEKANNAISEIKELQTIIETPSVIEKLSIEVIKKVFQYEVKKYFDQKIEESEEEILSLKEAYKLNFTEEIELIVDLINPAL